MTFERVIFNPSTGSLDEECMYGEKDNISSIHLHEQYTAGKVGISSARICNLSRIGPAKNYGFQKGHFQYGLANNRAH